MLYIEVGDEIHWFSKDVAITSKKHWKEVNIRGNLKPHEWYNTLFASVNDKEQQPYATATRTPFALRFLVLQATCCSGGFAFSNSNSKSAFAVADSFSIGKSCFGSQQSIADFSTTSGCSKQRGQQSQHKFCKMLHPENNSSILSQQCCERLKTRDCPHQYMNLKTRQLTVILCRSPCNAKRITHDVVSSCELPFCSVTYVPRNQQ